MMELLANKRCLIVGAAPLEDMGWLKALADRHDFCIGADGGCRHLLRAGRSPDLAIGDFDSGTVPPGVPVYTYPVEKDDTDAMLAVKWALEQGCRSFTLAGMVGGRLDHTVAALQTLYYLFCHGASGTLQAPDQWGTFLLGGGSLELPRQEGCTLSVFAYSEQVQGLTLQGVQYPLEQGELTNTFPLGVSNHFAAQTARISLAEGSLLILVCREY